MNKLIAIVGMSGSGKSIACEFLEKRGFQNIYFGGVVLDEVKKRGLELTRQNEKIVREDLRKKYGMSAVASILLPKIRKTLEKSDTVLDGLYSWDEYLVLKKEFKELKLIAIIADKEIRYHRVAERKVRPLNQEEIVKRDYSEIENLAKGGPIAIADYYVHNNDKTIEEYENELEKIISKIDKGEM